MSALKHAVPVVPRHALGAPSGFKAICTLRRTAAACFTRGLGHLLGLGSLPVPSSIAQHLKWATEGHQLDGWPGIGLYAMEGVQNLSCLKCSLLSSDAARACSSSPGAPANTRPLQLPEGSVLQTQRPGPCSQCCLTLQTTPICSPQQSPPCSSQGLDIHSQDNTSPCQCRDHVHCSRASTNAGRLGRQHQHTSWCQSQ